MLEKHGSAADAAIAAMLCEGILSPHTTGISGGFIATIYNKATNKVESLIARDVAPIAANKNMYNNIKPVDGGVAVAVPGEIKGYWELHKKYGKLKWSELFKPIIDLARSSKVSNFLAKNLKLKDVDAKMKKFASLNALLTNPKTNKPYEEGETIERPKLAETLELISKEGADTLYTKDGRLAKMFIEDVKKLGSNMTENDLAQYNVRWETPLSLDLGNGMKLYTAPTPGSGALLIFMLNVLKGHLSDKPDVQSYHRIAEAFKFAYAKRGDIGDAKYQRAPQTQKDRVEKALKLLEDKKFAEFIWQKIKSNPHTSDNTDYYNTTSHTPSDHGTANMNIIAPNGDAIAVTATINTL